MFQSLEDPKDRKVSWTSAVGLDNSYGSTNSGLRLMAKTGVAIRLLLIGTYVYTSVDYQGVLNFETLGAGDLRIWRPWELRILGFGNFEISRPLDLATSGCRNLGNCYIDQVV